MPTSTLAELSISGAGDYIVDLVGEVAVAGAAVIGATVSLGVAIWLVFKFLSWLRGAV